MDHGSPLENWLRNIRDTIRVNRAELDSLPTLTEKQRKLVEINVKEQCLNIFKSDIVQKRRIKTSTLVGTEG